MKTYSAKPADIDKKWLLVDAQDVVLGRLASQIAKILRGKHKPIFTPHMDTGDNVIVINAEKIAVTGKKMDQKMYYHHSGYPGGLKERTLRQMLDTYPDRVIRSAVWGMLPHNKLGRKFLKKLKVYAGTEHPHGPQQPKPLALD